MLAEGASPVIVALSVLATAVRVSPDQIVNAPHYTSQSSNLTCCFRTRLATTIKGHVSHAPCLLCLAN
jgi:hypothetical protein